MEIGPKVNTLDVDEQRTYADTSYETWTIIKFFLEELKPVHAENFEPEDRTCHICSEDFTNDFHRAVRLPCKHCFGEQCIKTWLRPYAACMPIKWNKWGKPVGANTCPTCRREFFPRQTTVDILPVVEARLKLWDQAYAHAGIPLSTTQRHARSDLLRYLHGYYAHGVDDYYPCYTAMLAYQQCAHVQFLKFCARLKTRVLAPGQESLRRRLEHVARHGVRWRQNPRGEMVFQVSVATSKQAPPELGAEAEVMEQLIDTDIKDIAFFQTRLD